MKKDCIMFKKISLSLLLACIGYSSQLFVMSQTVDAQGRTPLMNYVNQQENQLKTLADAFNSKRYLINKLLKSIVNASENKNLNLTKIIREDLDTTGALLKDAIMEVKDLDEKYDKMLAETLEEIVKMIQGGANLAAKDNKGNTVLHLCETKEIYETLRANGAPFQFDMWMKFTKKPRLSDVLHILLGSYLIYTTVNGKPNPLFSNPFLAYATIDSLRTLSNTKLYS